MAERYHLYSMFGIAFDVLRKSGVIVSLWNEPWAVLLPGFSGSMPLGGVGRNGCC